MRFFKGICFGCAAALLAFFVTPGMSFANNHFVSASASGNGSGADWNNAYRQLPASLVRGDTYYIGTGTYHTPTLTDPVSGNLVITIKAATSSDHGTDTGWSSGLATDVSGPAIFSTVGTGPFRIYSSYYTIDGQSRGTWTSGYNLKLDNSVGGLVGNEAMDIGTATTVPQHIVSNITIQYLEIKGTGDQTGTYHDRGIYQAHHDTSITIQYSYIHDFGECPILWDAADGPQLLQYNWIARNQSTAAIHSEGIAARGGRNVTIRYNYLEDIEGTGFIATPGTEDAAGGNGLWYIYGNVFFDSIHDTHGNDGNGVFAFFGFTSNAPIVIANNDIINVHGVSRIYTGTTDSIASMIVENNLWSGPLCTGIDDGNVAAGGVISWTYTHNAYFNGCSDSMDDDPNREVSATDPFVNYSGQDFRLASHTKSGITMTPVAGETFNQDLLGTARPDGSWDRGAFEFGNVSLPNPPTNLSATVQ